MITVYFVNMPDESLDISKPRRRKIPKALMKLFTFSGGSLLTYRTVHTLDEKEIEVAIKRYQDIENKYPTLAQLGVVELFTLSLYKALLVEFIGSAVQCFAHIAIVNACGSFTYPPLPIGVAHAILIGFMIYFFANSSGGHFNSLISISAASTGHITWTRGVTYAIVQLFGWFVGAQSMRAVLTPEQATSIGLGGCFSGDKDLSAVTLVDWFFSSLLLFSVYGTAFNPKQREVFGPMLPPLIIGITLGLGIFASSSFGGGTRPYTGAGMNPTLCYGILMSYSTIKDHPNPAFPDASAGYFLGPHLAIFSHYLLYRFAPPHFSKDDDESDDYHNEDRTSV